MQANKIKIFLHAIQAKSPDETVFVQATCLIDALGLSAASALTPHADLTSLISESKRRHAAHIAAIRDEIKRLEEAATLGLRDAVHGLRDAKKQLQAAATGRLQHPPLVSVLVGPFRAALTAALG